MDFSPAWILSSLCVGTLGFALFLYGKKQLRLPQLGAGLLLMGDSMLGSPAWMLALAALVLAGLALCVRAGV